MKCPMCCVKQSCSNKDSCSYSPFSLHLLILVLYVSLQGEDVIATLPWDEWWNQVLTKDDSNSHIALLPLHPDVRAKFNETAAWEYAQNMEGKPYGYHNMIFSWIDTLDENYPPPIDAHVVLFSSILEYFIFCLHSQYTWILYLFSFIFVF